MREPLWIARLPLLDVLGLPWPLWPWLLVPALLLGFPFLLAGWALWRLRTAPAGPGGRYARPGTAAPPLAIWPRLVRAYLLANYAAAVQLSGQRGKRVGPMVPFLMMLETVQVYTALYLLFTRPTGAYIIGWVSLALFVLAVYHWVLPRVEPSVVRHRIAPTYKVLSPRQQSAWGLLGQALLWGSFTFIFICIILRASIDKYS